MMYARYIKRPIDFVLALVLLLVLSWLLLLIGLVYMLSFQFPILFVQKRVGRNNTLFHIYKFRTLSASENEDVINRRFWLGDIMRFLSLDELPQLWNVLKGDMSLIGPRPLPEEYLGLYSLEQKRRHEVRPGITGWAQVNGRNSISWKQKFEYDLFYVNNISFALDLKILFKTVLLFFSFKKDSSLQEKRFEGD